MGHIVHPVELFGATLLRGITDCAYYAIFAGICTFLRPQSADLDGWNVGYGDSELGISHGLSEKSLRVANSCFYAEE